ncbi:hypothetical protein RRG48_05785 [Mycoplasmopsis canis]|uniref:hypothetical protein n=1 Tax=Mycoplasmopsis cynos TaxID=171284 RepID=UPI002AFE15FE|nr:hypothetical protein [Mycoplasmopsis cynos]WQQ12861.1 hypothetical protein RRG58_02695 [Mycoplasmopsis cynos]WQQ14070.1 hypothetical protein RRG52_00785 [Mycoplasmopsis cynos]
MSKYKKIFSGLGLLSISTLVGASVVACANKKPKPSDSSTEGIDQNNNQGNSTTPKDGENTPGNPSPEAPKTNPETSEEPKTETPKNPEMSKENPEQNDNTGQGDGSNSNKQEENKGEGGKDDSKQENKPTPTPKPKPEPKVTVEAKSMELLESIEKLPYPKQDAKAKQTLKSKVDEIKNKSEEENKKIEELVLLGKEIEQVNNKLVEVIKNIDELPYPDVPKLKEGVEIPAKDKFKEKLNDKADVKSISEVLPKDWSEKIKKYNEVFNKIGSFIDTNGLKKRFAQTDSATTGNFTESLLIWNIYETIRPKYIKKIKDLKLKDESKYIDKFKTMLSKNHKHDVNWLLKEITEMIDNHKKA